MPRLQYKSFSTPDDLRAMPKGLTQSWIAAQATLPPEWRLMGVVCGPREVDPKISSESWVAWARARMASGSTARAGSPEGVRWTLSPTRCARAIWRSSV